VTTARTALGTDDRAHTSDCTRIAPVKFLLLLNSSKLCQNFELLLLSVLFKLFAHVSKSY